MSNFDIGKLSPQLLEKCLKKIEPKDPRIIVGPKIGEDAAVLDMGDRYLVITTDPITFTEERIGWYCVHVNANDVAVKGAIPRWFTATLLLPEKRTDTAMVEKIFQDIFETCQLLNISLCGGHTEITEGIERPILVGQMLGEVSKEQLVTLDRMVPGDRILLTQSIAIEGTSILAKEKENSLLKETNAHMIQKAKNLLVDPGISVVEASLVACRAASLHGMHDPTEGGISTALWELAQAGRCGMKISGEAIPLLPETKIFSEILEFDPWGLLASGALLIVVDPEDISRVRSALLSAKIPCTEIGQVVPRNEGLTISHEGNHLTLEPFVKDEITRLL